MRHRAVTAPACSQSRHLVERPALREPLEYTYLRYVKVRVFDLALCIQLNRDLAMSFKASHGIDRDGLAHDQAPKRVSAGTSSGSPVMSAVSAVCFVSVVGGLLGWLLSSFSFFWFGF